MLFSLCARVKEGGCCRQRASDSDTVVSCSSASAVTSVERGAARGSGAAGWRRGSLNSGGLGGARPECGRIAMSRLASSRPAPRRVPRVDRRWRLGLAMLLLRANSLFPHNHQPRRCRGQGGICGAPSCPVPVPAARCTPNALRELLLPHRRRTGAALRL